MALLAASQLAASAARCCLRRRGAAPRSWLSTESGPLEGRNLLLMGAPGAGKTTVARIVGQKLGAPVVDVDDHVLEAAWKMPVAAKLASVGGRRFLEEEGRALCNFSASGCVVSLTGSNPLHADAMRHVRRHGLVVYLDVDGEDIMGRLGGMKVDRIVGQEAAASMRDVLLYRKPFYEKWVDVRVLCGGGDSAEEVAEKVLSAVRRYQEHEEETYVSTRSDGAHSSAQKTSFSDVVVEGLAADGGLYVPKNGFPKMSKREWLRLVPMSYRERALIMLEKCIHPLDVSALDLREMIQTAYGENFSSDEVAPVKHLVQNQFVQELFHGPTASFKDLALQLMPQLFAHCLPPMCNFLVLVATSGDTGGAVLSGFSRLSGAAGARTSVLVFFPEGGVSEIQKLQMTGFRKGNARAVGVRSDFDFCQKAIKKMLGAQGLSGHLSVEYGTVLSTANSINWARLLPQVVYHASSYLDLCRKGVVGFGEPVDVCIPTGNFGNAMSALYAKQMGVPIRRVICASNRNRVISDFVASGEYDLRGRPLLPSRSPAIDILKSSNVERLVHHVSGGDGRLVKELFTGLDSTERFRLPGRLAERLRRHLLAGCCSEEDCLGAVRSVHAQTGYLMDTHTAVAKVVADRLQDGSCPVVLCSTAHYGKFAPAMLEALGAQNVPRDPGEQLRKLQSASAAPDIHRELVASVEDAGRGGHRVLGADYALMVEEVESKIQDWFLKAER